MTTFLLNTEKPAIIAVTTLKTGIYTHQTLCHANLNFDLLSGG